MKPSTLVPMKTDTVIAGSFLDAIGEIIRGRPPKSKKDGDSQKDGDVKSPLHCNRGLDISSPYSRGLRQRNPGKRAKSRSVVWRMPPYSMVRAASWASVVKGPRAWPSTNICRKRVQC